MATSTSASITFQNRSGVKAKMHVPTAPSMKALRTFAYAIADYTTAKIIEISFSQTEEITDIPGASGEQQSLGTIALLLLHGEVGKTPSKDLAIPAPVNDLLELITGQGVKVKKADGQAIADIYGELVDETFRFVRGKPQIIK